MTVCIAAMCRGDEGDDVVILAADTMLSLGQFTSSNYHGKIHYIGGKWLVLAAGPTSFTDTLISRIAQGVNESSDVPGATQAAWESLRGEVAVARHFPPGLSLERFYREGNAILTPEVFNRLVSHLEETQLDGASLMLVGWRNGASQVVSFEDLWGGLPRPHRTEGYYAIGSGDVNALAILAGLDHASSDPWQEAAYRVYAARRFAERALGVGAGGPMLLANDDGVAFVDSAPLHQLCVSYGVAPTPSGWDEVKKALVGFAHDEITPWDAVPLFGASQ